MNVFYTTDVIKCEGGTENCVQFLFKEIEILNPKMIVAVGKRANTIIEKRIKQELKNCVFGYVHNYVYSYRWGRGNTKRSLQVREEVDNQYRKNALKAKQLGIM